MNLLRMQPTFAIEIPVSGDQAMAAIRAAIASPDLAAYAESAGNCVDFKILPSDQRFWSPHLSVQLDDSQLGSGATLFARFSPRPEIWTMFMAIYFVALIGVFAAAITGYVQWALQMSPWALLGMPIGIAIVFGLHLASLIGQNLSSDQMELLRSHLDQTLAIAFDQPEIEGSQHVIRTQSSDQ